ncbi:MAG: ATP-binding protein, partial [Pseudomonadota bacterium]
GMLAQEMNQMTDNLQLARKQLEEETKKRIRAIEQLRHADRLTTVGMLASGIAHELGTPINVIEGHAQLIREDATAGDAIKENTQLITRQCKRMTKIIRQLLDFSRRGTHKDVVADSCEVVRETLRMAEPLMRKQNIEVNFDDDIGEVSVAINFSQLQQVLMNIVINAIHAMPDGGCLTLHVSRCVAANPHTFHEGEYAAIVVTDTGAGMESETAKRIFEPFFTTKDVGEGTGLGLSIAFGIIKDHDGWFEVESELGRGSKFTIFLPLRCAT